MSISVSIFLADGFEEIEAVTAIDLFRRAGLDVTVYGLEKKEITGSRGVRVTADRPADEHSGKPDLVYLPGGGKGADNLAASDRITKIIQEQNAAGRVIAAICAAPAVVLAPAGVLIGKNATCYPGFESRFDPSTRPSEDRVVEDGNIMTSRGPGTAFEFSLAVIRKLAGPEVAENVAQAVLHKQ